MLNSVQNRQSVDPEPNHEPLPSGTPRGPHTASQPGPQALAQSSRTTATRPPPSAAEIRRNLDAQMQAMSGPYAVAGKQVDLSAAFRMMDGNNPVSAQRAYVLIKAALPPKTFASVQVSLGVVTAGKGTPAQIRRVTQALIDSPAWKKYEKLPAEDGIRQLMWDHCIGADCSGYVHHAFLAARNATASRYSLGDPLQSAIQAPPKAIFDNVSPQAARSGDVMVLGKKNGSGHKVIVYDRQEIPPGAPLRVAAQKGLGSAPDAKLHVLLVDSSWGAGTVAQSGGVARRAWVYDESQNKWGMLESSTIVPSNDSGPYDHPLQGTYRPKAEN
jgi:hypothetical protein